MLKPFLKSLHLVLFGLILVNLAACRSLPPSFRPDTQENSNPVFLSTPSGAGELATTPVPTTGQTIPAEVKTQPAGTQAAQAGELYIVLNDPTAGSLSLVRLPETCLLTETACPAPETVPGFPNLNEYIRPLSWSPDGRFAALPAQEQLFVFERATGAWRPILPASLPEDPIWSPDSSWIAFIDQREDLKDVYIVRPDGTGLRNLTNGQFASAEEHISSLFWTSSESLGFWDLRPQERKQIIEVSLASGQSSPLVSLSGMTKDVLVYSPDFQRIAMETLTGGVTEMVLVNTDGSNATVTGSYGQTSIWPVSWSPDGQWVAYSVYGSPDADPLSHAYVAPRDGSQQGREVLQAESVSALVWGSDSQHLVVQGQVQGAARLFLVNAQTGSASQLELPGVSPSAQLLGVSWRFVR